MLSPGQHLMLRQAAMSWALSTAQDGDDAAAVLDRAEQYLAFVLYPLRADVAAAMDEHRRATTH